MTVHTLPGHPPIEVLLRRSSRARRVSLRVSNLDGRVTLTLPKRATVAEAMTFARSKADWIRKHLSQRSAPVSVGLGSTILFQGHEMRVEAGPVRLATQVGNIIQVPNQPEMAGARIKAFLKLRAKAELSGCASYYAAKLNQRVSKITLRDTRSRWGSCTTEGNLMFSWRLIMAPPEVLDYVAAHEVAHLIEMNHSDAYWSIVRGICPGFDAHRRWLRQHGSALHRHRFDD